MSSAPCLKGKEAIAVEFPLRGEWIAANTPAHRIPSHGVDLLGQRYAYDFLRIDTSRKGFQFYADSHFRYWTRGVSIDTCYGWRETVHAPFAGEVVELCDSVEERTWLHPVVDLLRVVKNGLRLELPPGETNDSLSHLLGNYLILKQADQELFAFFAHFHPGSLEVAPGDSVHTGQLLARVGHTGNSTAPHLHFQLMDRIDLRSALGVPCCFTQLESLEADGWQPQSFLIPGRTQRIRYTT